MFEYVVDVLIIQCLIVGTFVLRNVSIFEYLNTQEAQPVYIIYIKTLMLEPVIEGNKCLCIVQNLILMWSMA